MKISDELIGKDVIDESGDQVGLVKDVEWDFDEAEVCNWSEKDLIKDISEDIADKVLEWLATIKRRGVKQR